MASTLSSIWYDVGDRVRLSIEIRDTDVEGDPLTDPDFLRFTMKEPNGGLTEFIFGQDAEVVKDGVGLYHVAWDITQAGTHWSRFAASGSIGAAEERGFKVRESKVV